MPPSSPVVSISFFTRNGLIPSDQQACDDFIQSQYHNCSLEPFECQGYCSYTIRIHHGSASSPSKKLIQFRPPNYDLNIPIIQSARQIYGNLIPETTSLGTVSLPNPPSRHGSNSTLLIYEMDLLPGTPYHTLQPKTPSLTPSQYTRHLHLIHSFASFLAQSYHSPSPSSSSTTSKPSGKVAPNIPSKLTLLTKHLPPSLRAHAARTLAQLPLLNVLPTVLNHGDLVPTNLLLDPVTFGISGVVDWAEAEYLPFGTCLYGLEYLLGYLEPIASSSSSSSSSSSLESGLLEEEKEGGRRRRRKWKWVYYREAGRLRKAFYRVLEGEIDKLGKERGEEGRGKEFRKAVEVARDVGVLLWFGFAWDEGRIDRVVEWTRDEDVCVCLEAFLGAGIERTLGDGYKELEAKL
ncbi:MAG: hypothetical protein M1820_005339 [Bogoriella megaspora]|nr:MAG: hypothetical protein M1820_005339 [Bogoriella megaspora]